MISLYAILAITGLMMTASDGIWFPTLNIAGCLLFCSCLYLANKQMERSPHHGKL